MSHLSKKHPVALSIGILAADEEDAIAAALESLFRQTAFERLCARHQQGEIIVVAHGCRDRTAAKARAVFERMEREYPWSDGFTGRVIDIPEAGRSNAWNRFVHEFSAVEARYLVAMDPHIAFHHRDTIFNLMAVLERRPHVPASTARRCCNLIFKEHQSLRDRFALATSALDATGNGTLCAELYCLRATVARNIFLPRDLGATEVGFINEMVCTEFLTREPDPSRVLVAREAAHVFEAEVAPRAALSCLRCGMLGRTAVHVLVEYLKKLPWQEQVNLADTLRSQEARDPDWLKRLIAAHVRERPFFWQLFPGALTSRWKRWLRMPGWRKVLYAPAAAAAWLMALIAGAQAARITRAGLKPYWAGAKAAPFLSAPHVGAK